MGVGVGVGVESVCVRSWEKERVEEGDGKAER